MRLTSVDSLCCESLLVLEDNEPLTAVTVPLVSVEPFDSATAAIATGRDFLRLSPGATPDDVPIPPDRRADDDDEDEATLPERLVDEEPPAASSGGRGKMSPRTTDGGASRGDVNGCLGGGAPTAGGSGWSIRSLGVVGFWTELRSAGVGGAACWLSRDVDDLPLLSLILFITHGT